MFQETDEGMNVEMVIVKPEIKVDSEEFSDANDDQANYDGMRWIIVCSFTVSMLYRFYCCFYDLFHDYIFILIKYGSLYLCVFFLLTQKKSHPF